AEARRRRGKRCPIDDYETPAVGNASPRTNAVTITNLCQNVIHGGTCHLDREWRSAAGCESEMLAGAGAGGRSSDGRDPARMARGPPRPQLRLGQGSWLH